MIAPALFVLSQKIKLKTSPFNLLNRLIVLLLMLLTYPVIAQEKRVAITIDDLPFVGSYQNFHLNRIVETLVENDIPATGFIIAGQVRPHHWKTLQKFRDAGLGLGNHTYSHLNLNQVDSETYIREIDKADKKLQAILTEPKFFRYPYVAMGSGEKKQEILDFLAEKNYHVAPISIDSHDYLFNQQLLSVPQEQRRHFLTELKQHYLDYIWKQTQKAEVQSPSSDQNERPQILLIHANLLNAYVLNDVIALYKQNGFTFVSLEDALLQADTYPAPLPQHNHKTTDQEEFMEWD